MIELRDSGRVHRTVLVVDVEAFSARLDPHQAAVRAALYRALEHAFAAAGIDWAQCHHEDRGDGVLVLSPGGKAPFVERLPGALAEALRAHNSTCDQQERIRLRMALHAGEVAPDERGYSGAAINLAFRLVDAKPVRKALAKSPGMLALVVSGWFHDDVVRHSLVLDQSAYWQVAVRVKNTRAIGWITLPDTRSGNPLRRRRMALTAAVLGVTAVSASAAALPRTGVVEIGADLPSAREQLVEVVSERTGLCLSRNGVYTHPNHSEVPGFTQASDLYQWACDGSDNPGHNLVLAPFENSWLIRSSVRTDLCFAADGAPARSAHFQICQPADVRQLWRLRVVSGRYPRTIVVENRETGSCIAADGGNAIYLDACEITPNRRTEWTVRPRKSFADKECAPDGARLRNHETGQLIDGALHRAGETALGCTMSLAGQTWLSEPVGEAGGTLWYRVHSSVNHSRCLEPDGNARFCTSNRAQQWAVEST